MKVWWSDLKNTKKLKTGWCNKQTLSYLLARDVTYVRATGPTMWAITMDTGWTEIIRVEKKHLTKKIAQFHSHDGIKTFWGT